MSMYVVEKRSGGSVRLLKRQDDETYEVIAYATSKESEDLVSLAREANFWHEGDKG